MRPTIRFSIVPYTTHIHYSTIRTMAQLYDVVNQTVQLVTGSCRKLVTPEGRSISALTEFVDGGKYIACAGEPLNRERSVLLSLLYLTQRFKLLVPHALTAKHAAAPAHSAPPEHSAPPVHPAPKVEHKPLQKFGTMATKPKIIYVFRNGDIHDQGTRITLKATVTTMEKLHQTINSEVHLVTGSCRKVVTPEGREIRSLSEFQDEGKYIALAGEPLNKERMSRYI